ncbi:hypothetical protein JAAARDRAFT_42520 [Jaapia argillacea MUCL 33604]|uniref:Protein kinase domain-containing protein n=1 Tax=Jaapia argillacea MUCL 33604 TaxID=933084 RepID=A0A067PG22_9AGAM|nr:hypothetical protein JAAARDRAFT_42520 [Jaapia argillacea MUCL 33604]
MPDGSTPVDTTRSGSEPPIDQSIIAWANYAHHIHKDDLEALSQSDKEEINTHVANLVASLKRVAGDNAITEADQSLLDQYREGLQSDHLPLDFVRSLVILWLRCILESDAPDRVLALRGEEARTYMTALQEFLDWMRNEPKVRELLHRSSAQEIRDLRRRTIRLLSNLSRASQDFPPELFLPAPGKLPRDPVEGGGYADVYKVLSGDKYVCCKLMRAFHNAVQNPEARRLEFFQEAIVWRQVSHPCVVPLLGVWQAYKDKPLLVSPFLELGSANKYVGKRTVRAKVVNTLLLDSLDGLVYLHSIGVVHGDLSGKNVLVEERDGKKHARLCDFGLSGIVTNPTSLMHNANHQAHGGTVRWQAPETQDAMGNAAQLPSMKSDVYSFGSLALEFYTGTAPWGEENDEAQVGLKVVQGLRPEYPDDRVCGRLLPMSLWSLIGDCWKQDPLERPDAATVLDRLRALVSV